MATRVLKKVKFFLGLKTGFFALKIRARIAHYVRRVS